MTSASPSFRHFGSVFYRIPSGIDRDLPRKIGARTAQAIVDPSASCEVAGAAAYFQPLVTSTTITYEDMRQLRKLQQNGGASRPEASRPASRAWVDRRVSALAEGAAGAIGVIIAELRSRVTELETQLRATNERRHYGTWTSGQKYKFGHRSRRGVGLPGGHIRHRAAGGERALAADTEIAGQRSSAPHRAEPPMMTSNATAIAQTRARLFEVMAAMDVEPSDILNVTALLSQCGRRVLVMVSLAGASELFGEDAPFCPAMRSCGADRARLPRRGICEVAAVDRHAARRDGALIIPGVLPCRPARGSVTRKAFLRPRAPEGFLRSL